MIPASLAERRRWVVAPDETDHPPGEMVLYWMHNAVRGHENPALDAAIWLAHQNGLPLLVYHGLSEKYPYASDRHHAFIMQGARDVQRELQARGITYTFHLERRGHRGPHLRDLCRRAAVLVSEEMPVAPIACWVERLRSLVTTPIMLVDTSCVVPSQSIAAVPERAFEFRHLIQDELQDRLGASYAELPANMQPAKFTGSLGFDPIDLQDVDLAGLISQCKIDHSVGPVSDTPGGTRAGYARWDHFREESLRDYSRQRSQPDDPLGVSRLSGYLHYGMISPFRIAREAAALGARKYVDELVVWREMVFRFCLEHVEDLDTMDVLPRWARETLRKHADDPRVEVLDWESLARGKSSYSLWNLAQRSLLQHGELHHKLRMTWGKAFLAMTSQPSQAFAQCIDLNHRYAIDGRSPISYSGILWCFGQFDRPSQPEQPVYGTVRLRAISKQVKRVDPSRIAQWVNRPIAAKLPRIAIVGAGLAGLTAARTLADHGMDVQVFEKSRGVGGRLATRRCESGSRFDHGAQYFTVRDDRFARYVRSWIQQGLVEPWLQTIVELRPSGKIVEEKCGTPRYVGVPGMNSIGKHLSADLNVQLQTTVVSLEQVGDRWKLRSEDSSGSAQCEAASGNESGEFDCVIMNCPPAQAVSLLEGHSDIADTAKQVEMMPCWSMMIRGEGLPDLGFAGAFINEGPLSWIARNDAKPGREKSDESSSSWVLHASTDWSQKHLEQPADWVAGELHSAFERATGQRFRRVIESQTHRWRYANPASPLDQDCLWDPSTGLGACGDWCGGPRVEGAFLSGMALAGAVLRHATIDRVASDSSGLAGAVTPMQTADVV